MADQFLKGALSAYINTIYYPTAEDVTYKAPFESNIPTESNQGPLVQVVTWNKEAGTINVTVLHYSGCDYVGNFSAPAGYDITLNGRSGNSIVAKGCWLTEAPNHNQVQGTTELVFGTMSMEFILAS
ncbi:hypothetical protein HKD28_15140 [Gluconobacter sp. LMG 1744]|jgi:hypothetical protein|uniref:phage tail tube protein n=1 Tax=Gluconobacter cadivus TaxID=2728101 RepID=UPI0018859C0F|nr:phage tail tube protein [Gluconobacter cadivus]MBF0892726.1 hypothetical protein [Gluconobacter cadivus]